MKHRDFHRWLLVTLVFWVPLSLALLLGMFQAGKDRLRVQSVFLHEGMNFDFEKIQRARQPAFQLSLPWAEIRSGLAEIADLEQWQRQAAQGLTAAGLPADLLLVWDRQGNQIFPQGHDAEAFRGFMTVLRERRNQQLEKRSDVIRFSGINLPVHLALRMNRRHQFYPMQVLGRKWWLAHGPIRGRNSSEAYYLVLVDQVRISSVQLFPLWKQRLQKYLHHSLSEYTLKVEDPAHSPFSDEEALGERWFHFDSTNAVAGIRLPDVELRLSHSFPLSARSWTVLALVAWSALSFAWLLGSFRVWVSGDDPGLLTVRTRIRTHLGAAVGLPLLGIILMGEIQINSKVFSTFYTEQDEMSRDLERVEQRLDDQVLETQAKMKKVADALPPVYTREEATRLCFDVLEGEYHLSNAHLLSSSGVYLPPIHFQNKPGFHYVTLFSRARREWFLQRFFGRGGVLEPYYEKMLNMYQPQGQPLTPVQLKQLIKTMDRRKPFVDSVDSVWERAMGVMARETCRKFNQRAGLLDETTSSEEKGDSIGMMAAVAGIEHDDLLNETMEHMGKIQRFNTAKESIFDMVYLIRDQSGRAHNLLFLHWRNEALTFPYVHAMARHAKKNPQSGGLYFFCDDHDALDLVSTPIPRGVRFIASSLRRAGESQRYLSCMPNGEWRLFQFRRCRTLDHLIIGCSRPAERAIHGVGPDRRRFFVGFFGLVGVVSLLLLLLGRFLIRPLEGVEEAVARLSRPGEAFPEIPDPVGEVRTLIRLFAEVKTGLKQLDVARLVQEDLLPQGVLEHRRLRVTGRSRMMEQVGGDFFDMVIDPRDARYVYVGIGDVTGHGLAAAIVVAMISSAVRLLSHTRHVTPEEFLTTMNPHLVRILKRVRMTSFQITRINGDTGEFQFASGGHPPLLQMKTDQEPISWEIAAFPLGSKKNTKYPGKSGRLEPREGLIFCTDGCIEATMPSGQEVGYPGFARLARHEFDAGFEGVIPRLFDRFEQMTGTTSWNDDVTMVVLAFDRGHTDADEKAAGGSPPAADVKPRQT